jgi:hypothetical protein
VDSISDVVFKDRFGDDINGGRTSYGGDVNGDGFDDVLISSTPSFGIRDVYVYLGGNFPDGLPDAFATEFESNGYGEEIAGAGDVNRDGVDDIIVGAQNWFFGRNQGKAYLYSGSRDIVGIKTEDNGQGGSIPRAFHLSQNFPNPFNPSTTIEYEIPDGSNSIPVALSIYDIRGRLIRTLVREETSPGQYQVHWDGRDDRAQAVSSGVYLYRLGAGERVESRKMILLK